LLKSSRFPQAVTLNDQLEAVHIEEVRGIRKLDIDFGRETFAISGPNGSGKSGVIDAIEFGLTGQIGRLTGTGTKGLSVLEHGPHVDKTKFPDAAFVEIRVYFPNAKKSARIIRKISSPSKPKILPSDTDVVAAVEEIASHPEVVLSRREILRFILVEPTKRSEEIQALLRLEEIGRTRSALNTAQNRLQTAQQIAATHAQSNRDALQRHLQIATLLSQDLLDVVNRRRNLLGLSPIAVLMEDTKLDSGLSTSTKVSDFNKQSALQDVRALIEAMDRFPELAKAQADAMIGDLSKLESDPALLSALQRRSFIEKGLALIQGPECPLCDHRWNDEKDLRERLKAKLAKSNEAWKLQQSLINNGMAIAREIVGIANLLAAVQKIAEGQGEAMISQHLLDWRTDLEALKASIVNIDRIMGLRARLQTGWLAMPKEMPSELSDLSQKIEARPDQTATVDAQTFLSTAQLRLGDYREASRKRKAAEMAAAAAKVAYSTYCDVLQDELNKLYEEVEKDFSTFYQVLNEDDEAKFTAKFTPTEGKLDLDVNFYERGLFPPGAYHSEGHQDGMGVCLYLALMKRLFGNGFTFALLDDVVMSVDAGHRYQFCRLLKSFFPGTQFIITTHDRLWAEQMRSAGLVSAKRSLAFHSWTIDTGPLVESNLEIWDEIGASLKKGKVETAALALRHHLEYASHQLADQLGAMPPFRADGNYELGDLLPSVLTRMKSLCGKAADAANSWGNQADKSVALNRADSLSRACAASNVEQWAVNKAVHYNEWANFSKKDFEPVVIAFRGLLDCFRCATCDSWLYVAPRGRPDSLRCACNAINLNLKPKPK
jgi:hypothetical protein